MVCGGHLAAASKILASMLHHHSALRQWHQTASGTAGPTARILPGGPSASQDSEK
jgi:hypothetical protein